MARQTIDIVRGDKLYNLSFTVTDYDSVAIDLTGATDVKLKTQRVGASTLHWSHDMTVTDAVSGEVNYLVADNDFEVGKYNAEIEVTFGSGEITTFPDLRIDVKSDIPATAVSSC